MATESTRPHKGKMQNTDFVLRPKKIVKNHKKSVSTKSFMVRKAGAVYKGPDVNQLHVFFSNAQKTYIEAPYDVVTS